MTIQFIAPDSSVLSPSIFETIWRNFDSPILKPCCNWLNVIETPGQLHVWLLPPKNYRTVTCSHTCTHTYACMCRFKDCWPAMAKDAQGLFIVYNTDADEDNQKEIERWYKISLIEWYTVNNEGSWKAMLWTSHCKQCSLQILNNWSLYLFCRHKVFAGPNKLSDAACRVVGLTTNVNLLNTSPCKQITNSCQHYCRCF